MLHFVPKSGKVSSWSYDSTSQTSDPSDNHKALKTFWLEQSVFLEDASSNSKSSLLFFHTVNVLPRLSLFPCTLRFISFFVDSGNITRKLTLIDFLDNNIFIRRDRNILHTSFRKYDTVLCGVPLHAQKRFLLHLPFNILF